MSDMTGNPEIEAPVTRENVLLTYLDELRASSIRQASDHAQKSGSALGRFDARFHANIASMLATDQFSEKIASKPAIGSRPLTQAAWDYVLGNDAPLDCYYSGTASREEMAVIIGAYEKKNPGMARKLSESEESLIANDLDEFRAARPDVSELEISLLLQRRAREFFLKFEATQKMVTTQLGGPQID